MVVPYYPIRFTCTCFSGLLELGCDTFCPDAALGRPDDERTASVDSEPCPNLGIIPTLADVSEHLALGGIRSATLAVTIGESRHLCLCWQEHGGSPGARPIRKSSARA